MDTSVMFKIGYGLYVLTAKDDTKDNGCVINTVMQVTSNPLQVAIAVNKKNYTNEMIQKTRKFNLSILSEKADFEIYKHFGYQSGREVDKFASFADVRRSPNGVLYITKGTNAYLSAYVQQEVDLGTHSLFIAQLVASESLSNDKSATYDYYQNFVKPKTENVAKKGWRCKICGYIYEGENLPADYICPVCKHGASDFERV